MRHTKRLSCTEYLLDGRKGNSDYFYTEYHGAWRYLVMSAGCNEANRHQPNKVDRAEASLFIQILRLQPAEDRSEGFFTEHGIIRDGHFSMSKFCGFWEKYAVVRIDTWLLEGCRRGIHAWGKGCGLCHRMR